MASGQTQNRPYVACSLCMGTGQDAFAPHRETAGRDVMYLVRACPECEGRGVVAPDHPSQGTVGNLGGPVFRSDSSVSQAVPTGVTDMGYQKAAVPS